MIRTASKHPAWLVAQRWERLLFAHWPVEPARLARLLPPKVEPDVREGNAWVAFVAFVMVGTRASGPPWWPVLAPIPELNLRTYVRVGGVPAVWFLSLDAASALFATIGRALYGLRYRVATMSADEEAGRTRFRSVGPGRLVCGDLCARRAGRPPGARLARALPRRALPTLLRAPRAPDHGAGRARAVAAPARGGRGRARRNGASRPRVLRGATRALLALGDGRDQCAVAGRYGGRRCRAPLSSSPRSPPWPSARRRRRKRRPRAGRRRLTRSGRSTSPVHRCGRRSEPATSSPDGYWRHEPAARSSVPGSSSGSSTCRACTTTRTGRRSPPAAAAATGSRATSRRGTSRGRRTSTSA